MSRELEYFDALRLIASFMTPEKLKRECWKRYGLAPEEAMEMAYGNIRNAAMEAVKGRRRPVSK